MFYIVAVMTGVLTAMTIVANGQLGETLDIYRSSVLVHVVGLFTQSLITYFKKADTRLRSGLPFWCYMGGTMGVFTVVFSNYAFTSLGVTGVLALNLLGMSVMSVLTDQFGWFGMRRYPLTKYKALSIAIITAGVLLLLLPLDIGAGLSIVLAFMTGVIVVVSRTMNTRTLHFYNLPVSTMLNYLTGLITSVILLVIMNPGALMAPFPLDPNWIMYTGGAVGAIMVSLVTLITSKLSAFNVTVLTFLGQYFFGMVIDAFIGRTPTVKGVVAGLIVLLGLIVNYLANKRTGTLVT